LRKILLFWKYEWLDVGQLRDAICGSDDNQTCVSGTPMRQGVSGEASDSLPFRVVWRSSNRSRSSIDAWIGAQQ
jgi:hypothetical protein